MMPLSTNKKKLLVLGSSGFIGTNLINHFIKNDNYEVFGQIFKSLPKIIDYKNKNGCSYHQADLTDKSEVEQLFNTIKPDIVLQYAAYTTNSKDVVESPFTHATTNYIINSLVLEASHKVRVKHFIYPSCSTMYASSVFPKAEEDWSLDKIPYCYKHVAYMKTAVERMMDAYASMGKCKYTVIRQSNVFGPWDKTDLDKCHMFMAMVNKIVNAKDSIEVWGNPTNQAQRDLIYVDDVINMVEKTIDKQESPFEIFNCGKGDVYSISEIIIMICGILNKKVEIIFNSDKPSIPTTTILDISKAKKMLGWEPLVSFKTGVRETIEWYKNVK